MKRVAFSTLGVIASSLLVLPSVGALTNSAPHVTDAKYGISFSLPNTWTHLEKTLSTSGLAKLQVEDRSVSGTLALVEVEVVPGRQISAAEVAKGILTNSGTSIRGSKIVKFSTGDAEQLMFSLQVPGDPIVYGTVEGFYRAGRSYYVSIDSPYRSVVNRAVTTVMNSWGK